MAETERLGSLVISPANGDLDTPLDLVTEGECTRGTTFVVAVEGKGLSSQRGNLVGATKIQSLGLPRYPGHYVVPVASTLREYLLRSLDRARLSGDYQIVFVCRNSLDTEPLQEYVGSVRVDEDGGYAALGAAGREVRDVVGAEAFALAEEADRLSREAEMAATEPEVIDPEVSEAPVGATVAAPDDGPDPAAGIEWRTILLLLGAMLLLGASYSWWRSRSRATQADTHVRVQTDDESVGAAN
jgi:hypothetical protein